MSKYYKGEDIKNTLIELIESGKRLERNTTINIIKALNSLPTIEVSEDCISREWLFKNYQTVCATVTCSECSFDNDDGSYCKLADFVMDAPSVVPSGTEGEWIGTEYDGYADGNPVYYEWICSACKCVVEDEEPTWNYCPNCGAKMKGADDEQTAEKSDRTD